MNRSLLIPTARVLKRLKKKKRRKEGRKGGRKERRKGSIATLTNSRKKLVRSKEIEKGKRSETVLLHHT